MVGKIDDVLNGKRKGIRIIGEIKERRNL